MITKRNATTILTVAMLACLLAVPMLAQGRHGGGARRPGPVHGLSSRGILAELIYPCQSACAQTGRDCGEAANDTAVSCISSACSAEVTAAQTACAEERSSEECRDAVDALLDCGDTCLDTRSAALDTCRDAQRDCRDACEADTE